MQNRGRQQFGDEALELLRQFVLVAEGLDLGRGPGELVESFNRARKGGVGLLDLARALVTEAGYDLPPRPAQAPGTGRRYRTH